MLDDLSVVEEHQHLHDITEMVEVIQGLQILGHGDYWYQLPYIVIRYNQLR